MSTKLCTHHTPQHPHALAPAPSHHHTPTPSHPNHPTHSPHACTFHNLTRTPSLLHHSLTPAPSHPTPPPRHSCTTPSLLHLLNEHEAVHVVHPEVLRVFGRLRLHPLKQLVAQGAALVGGAGRIQGRLEGGVGPGAARIIMRITIIGI